ncbi:MAG: hypothetical protein A2077_07265 [Nitrospirae bacterium GWC2_46_6]|nr:MAG: hypothetical protein A2077_07265 [Nitrospirae bacterium GWC2_46_6]
MRNGFILIIVIAFSFLSFGFVSAPDREAKNSYNMVAMTVEDAKYKLIREADRKGFSAGKKAEIVRAFEKLSIYMPVKEAYKMVLIRFNLTDMEKLRKEGSYDYEDTMRLSSQ